MGAACGSMAARSADTSTCTATMPAGALADAELDAWADALGGMLADPLPEGHALSTRGFNGIAAELTTTLLLGGKAAAEDVAGRNSLGATHLLNCCEPWCASGPNLAGGGSVTYQGFEAYDEEGWPLLKATFEPAARPFLDACAAAGGRCLVHCARGANRSAAICVAWLLTADPGATLFGVASAVKHKRGHVLGNRSFRRQLVAFAAGRGQLDAAGTRARWLVVKRAQDAAQQAADEAEGYCAPPPSGWGWQAPPAPGGRCRVNDGGRWRRAVVKSCQGGMAEVEFPNGQDDWVAIPSPDLFAEQQHPRAQRPAATH